MSKFSLQSPSERSSKTAFVAILIALAIPLGDALASNPPPQPPGKMLVYRTRNTESTTGNYRASSTSVGLLLVAPPSPASAKYVPPFSTSPEPVNPVDVSVNVSPIRSYNFYQQDSVKAYWVQESQQMVGFFNTAPSNNTTRPAYNLASSAYYSIEGSESYVQNYLTASDAIGKAVFASPFPGAPRIWHAPNAKSSFSYFDFTPEARQQGPEYSGDFNFLGQTNSSAVPAVFVSGGTTFKLDRTLTKLVHDLGFEAAQNAIAAELQRQGFTPFDPGLPSE
jgi:hypothetical protein